MTAPTNNTAPVPLARPVEQRSAVTLAVAPHAAPPVWRTLLPPGRRFVALPSARRPLILAEDDRGVQSYVRTALLAVPPRSALPGWAYAGAGQLLRIPALWRVLPTLDRAGRDIPACGPLRDFVSASGARLLLLQHSRDPDPRLILLMFDPGSRSPRFAVKIATGTGSAALVLAERAKLDAVAAATGDGALVEGLPRVIDLLTHDGLPALVTTARPGVPMLVAYHRRGHTAGAATVGADLAMAGDWLTGVQAATSGPPVPLDLAPGVTDGLARVSDGIPERTLVADRVARLRDRLRRHLAPATLVHGDFWSGNMLVERGAISGVVDWEHTQQAGNPLRDWARFVVGYSAYLDRHTRPGRPVRGHPGLISAAPGGGVGYALGGSGWYPELVAGFLRRGLAAAGLPPACARDAVLGEVAALAAEAGDPGFARKQLRLFLHLSTSPS